MVSTNLQSMGKPLSSSRVLMEALMWLGLELHMCIYIMHACVGIYTHVHVHTHMYNNTHGLHVHINNGVVLLSQLGLL